MAGAGALNVRRGETRAFPENVVLGVISALVAVGLVAAGLAEQPQTGPSARRWASLILHPPAEAQR
jgi:hypothetical protein